MFLVIFTAIFSGTTPALGLALTSLIPNGDAAPAVVNASILPLLFLSGVFIPLPDHTTWYVAVAKIFPIYHFTHAMLSAFFWASVSPTGSGFQGKDLLIM